MTDIQIPQRIFDALGVPSDNYAHFPGARISDIQVGSNFFGAIPGLDQPGEYNYEISEKDRRTFEGAMADTESKDLHRARAARAAILFGLSALPMGTLLKKGGNFLFNFFGVGIRGNITLDGPGSGAWFAEHEDRTAHPGEIAMGVSLNSSNASAYVLNGQHYGRLQASTTRYLKSYSTPASYYQNGYSCQSYGGTEPEYCQMWWWSATYSQAHLRIAPGYAQNPVRDKDWIRVPTSTPGDYGGGYISHGHHYNVIFPHPTHLTVEETKAARPKPGFHENPPESEFYGLYKTNTVQQFLWDHTGAWIDGVQQHEYPLTIPADRDSNGNGRGVFLTGENFQYVPGNDHNWFIEEFLIKQFNLYGGMADDSWGGPGMSMDDITFEDPGGFDPGQSDLDKDDMTKLIGDICSHPEYAQFCDNPEFPGDPAFPPGHPGHPGFPCGGAGGTPIGRIDGKVPPRIKIPSPGYQDGLPPPGYRPGDPICFGIQGSKPRCGIIGGITPKPPGHDEIIIDEPPWANDNFEKNWCRKNILVLNAIKQLAGELGLDPSLIIVNSDCKKRWTGCFKKDTSKFDALWTLADMCQVYLITDPDPEIIPAKPAKKQHVFHSRKNLYEFNPVYDGLDLVHTVVYRRPPYRNIPGVTIERRVNTVFHVSPGQREVHVVGNRMTKKEMIEQCEERAKFLGMKVGRIQAAVPYTANLHVPHQATVYHAAKKFRQNYMVIDVSHQSDGRKTLTYFEGVFLDHKEYPPAPVPNDIPVLL